MQQSMRKALAGVLAMGAIMASGVAQPAAQTDNSGNTQTQRDAVNEKPGKVEVQREVKRTNYKGNYSYKHEAGRFLNQRQYRKLCAQNTHLRTSKKHRSKN